MSSSLNALQSLTANDPLALYAMREKRLDEMKRNRELAAQPTSGSTQYSFGGPRIGPATFGTGATNTDVEGLQSDMESDPSTGLKAQALADDVQGVARFNRPDVAGMRHQQEEDALRRLLEPIRLKGQYEVEVAKQGQAGKLDLADTNNTARMAQEELRQRNMNGRVGAMAENEKNRQRLHDLQIGKAHATRPAGLMDSLFGPSQKTLDDAEVTQLLKDNPELLTKGADAAPDEMLPARPPVSRPNAADLIRRYSRP